MQSQQKEDDYGKWKWIWLFLDNSLSTQHQEELDAVGKMIIWKLDRTGGPFDRLVWMTGMPW